MSAFWTKPNKIGLRSVPTEVDKNFGLTQAAFTALCASLREGEERLFETIFLRHFHECRQYLCRMDRATEEAAHEAVMETMLRFRGLLIAGKVNYGNLRYLFTLMARQYYHRKLKQQPPLVELTAAAIDIPEQTDTFTQEDYDLLARVFNTMGKDCRELLKAFYFSGASLKKIAEDEGRSHAAVRKQKSRCIAIFRKYFYYLSET